MTETIAAQDERRIRIEPPAIHIDVHVHLAEASMLAPATVFRGPLANGGTGDAASPKRPMLGSVLIAFLVSGGILLSGVIGYRAGSGASKTTLAANEPRTLAQGSDSPSKEPPRSRTLPESLARELERPPQITPPPGAVDAHTPSGPAAFGLHE
jgi:hypothetical protein